MAVKASYVILALLILAVVFNSVFINMTVKEIYAVSNAADDGTIEALGVKFEKLNKLYESRELLISLSVSHDDLTDIEEGLSEIEGALKAGDLRAATIAKSRFENALLHLGRLSGFNFESIL